MACWRLAKLSSAQRVTHAMVPWLHVRPCPIPSIKIATTTIRQNSEQDEQSASMERIGGGGLTIHEELIGQDDSQSSLDRWLALTGHILWASTGEDMNREMDSTSNGVDFVQKVAIFMKKAGAKGQIMIIFFLMILFIVLFVLVFFT